MKFAVVAIGLCTNGDGACVAVVVVVAVVTPFAFRLISRDLKEEKRDSGASGSLFVGGFARGGIRIHTGVSMK